MSFFWRTLDVVGSFHYGHIQFLNKATSNHKNFTINRIESNQIESNRIDQRFIVYGLFIIVLESEREREKKSNRVIAVDMGEADFGAVFEGAIGFSPSL